MLANRNVPETTGFFIAENAMSYINKVVFCLVSESRHTTNDSEPFLQRVSCIHRKGNYIFKQKVLHLYFLQCISTFHKKNPGQS